MSDEKIHIEKSEFNVQIVEYVGVEGAFVARVKYASGSKIAFEKWLNQHDHDLREKIAKEIEVEMRRHDHAQIGFSAVGDAYAHAARIARGEQA